MRWLSVAGTAVLGLCGIWLLLLAYRVVGKPRGQNAGYDASADYWSGTFKVIGVLSILVNLLEVAVFILDWVS
jgi:hypothetical protein